MKHAKCRFGELVLKMPKNRISLELTPEAEQLLLRHQKRTGLSVASQIQQGIADYLLKLIEREAQMKAAGVTYIGRK